VKPIGRTRWAFAGGHIPLHSHGHEPEFTSRDELCVLNASEREAHLEMTIYYADRAPVGPYRLAVQAQRTRHVRLNDLIDPEAIPLGTDYASVIESDVPVVIQFSRFDSSQAEAGLLSIMAFSDGE
jgi:hypothetical protein